MLGKRGFSLIEFVIVIAILAILAGISVPYLIRYYRVYKYNEYVLQVESTLKWARLIAMERGVNVGICVQNNALTIYDMGTRRWGVCSGDIIKKAEVEDNFIILNATGEGTGFDPRGLAIFSSTFFVKRTDTEQCVCYTIQPLRGLIRRGVCNNNTCQ